MNNTFSESAGANLLASLRVVLVTIVLCGGLYPLVISGIARLVAPERASGSLLRDSRGAVVGSRLIAQSFSQSRYFWPRPSAVGYNASAAGGSNLSPAGAEVRDRAMKAVATYQVHAGLPIPADLVTASGSGLDPCITLQAALWQAPRVAHARGVQLAGLERRLRYHAWENRPFWSGEGLVNVLEMNRELDTLQK
ncbi:MAG: K(+)-transporting ATPase subunit C [Chlorobiaceae bacterium]|nr:K(+)-transporting ATPase subunit C [Chlorobiaceae bacterium]